LPISSALMARVGLTTNLLADFWLSLNNQKSGL